jgi:hypothetical protein
MWLFLSQNLVIPKESLCFTNHSFNKGNDHQMTFLLTFANDSKDFLKLLKAECDEIKKMLRPLERKGFIKFEDDDSAT